MVEACCKVGAAIEAYDLPVPPGSSSIDEHLVDRWTGADDRSSVGYRTLTDWFNRRLLRAAYLANDRSATETRIEGEYAALVGDDELRREEVIADLESDGIDGEALANTLVSRSTMSRHLTRCLGADKPSSSEASDGEWEREKIQHGRRVFQKGVSEALRSLSNKDVLPGADGAELELPVLLSCPDCATRIPLRTALDRGYVCADHLGGGEEPVRE